MSRLVCPFAMLFCPDTRETRPTKGHSMWPLPSLVCCLPGMTQTSTKWSQSTFWPPWKRRPTQLPCLISAAVLVAWARDFLGSEP